VIGGLDNGSDPAEQNFKPMADINVTPMVDVMLVLLVIFMVTAPLMITGVPVNLPSAQASKVERPKSPVVVTLAADRSLHLRDKAVPEHDLVPELVALRGAEGDAVVYLRADRTLPYGDVMAVLALIGQAGYQRISLLSHPQADQGNRPQ
jgi:biopolymer transport protein ExbD